jgi:DNA polymerase-3 subunit gamma/tau
MSAQVLARKWRPRDFVSLIGQDHVVRALTHALEHKRLHHAYLFTGTRGVGKTTIARILAKSLNCIGPDGGGDVTATPCNVCDACTAIDAGRFVDYIEMDAASNRGVDEMTALLERAVYAPSNARFKVYMIDEVHMLSKHAFNAMLKTLEEPPGYVKFILATTDPQQVPVTVLSRCLQFNLKQMTPHAVADHLAHVLAQEGVAFEPEALRALSFAARGSMRDGLSLLDQAIAFAGGAVTAEAVRDMLGAIDTTWLARVLDAVAARDAKAAIAIADEMASRSLSFAQALRDLASLLARIGLVQQVPDALTEDAEDGATLRRFAASIGAEDVQLLYQIALHGRNDLRLAPDDYVGFTMTLLRMIAFSPVTSAGDEPKPLRVAALQASTPPRTSAPVAPARAAKPAPTTAARTEARASDHGSRITDHGSPAPITDWPAFVGRLKVVGMVKELATRSELVEQQAAHLKLRVPIKTLAEGGTVEKLQAAVSEALGRAVRISTELGAAQGLTAAAIAEQYSAARQKAAEEAIYADPFVRGVIETFGATVDPKSIRPVD